MQEMFILSLIQSLTEFLPVSSSGHLVLAEKFGFTNQTLAVDIALHVGTLVAVLAYFYKDVWFAFTGFWKQGAPRSLLLQLIVATIPTVIIGGLFADIVEDTFRSLFIIAFTAIFYGIILWISDKYSPSTQNFGSMHIKDALYIGMAQVLALVPGTSRSGITMTCARFRKINRSDAARFSMLLSIPTIGLGGLYMFYLSWKENTLNTLLNTQLLWGMGLSALFGFLAIWILMRWVKTGSFAIFAIYRVLLGLFLIYYFL